MKQAFVMALLVALCAGCATVKNDYEHAKHADTSGAYSQFLMRHPVTAFTDDANSRMDEALWREVRAQAGMQAYKNYMTQFPNGRHVKDATAAISAIQDDKSWESAEKEASGGNNTMSATGKDGERLSLKSIDQTIAAMDAYKVYINNYPTGRHVAEARTRLSALDKLSEQMKQAERSFDSELSTATDLPSLEALLSKHANSSFAAMALARVETKLVAQIDSAGPGSRYTIKEFQQKAGTADTTTGIVSRLTLSPTKFKTETPEDGFPLTTSSILGKVTIADLTMPGSIQRFDGTVVFKPSPEGGIHLLQGTESENVGYKFTSEGDQFHRLTFYLSRRDGYVYLRGKGVVVPKGGEPVKLGY